MKIITDAKRRKQKTVDHSISSELINLIGERMTKGKPVRRTLPLDGRVHIDRTLPFLVVYRRPTKYLNKAVDRLVKGEASYLVASASQKLQPSLKSLIRSIVKVSAAKCDGFLIIELWEDSANKTEEASAPGSVRPEFRIVTSDQHPPTRTVEAFSEALKRIRIDKKSASVDIVYAKNSAPPKLKPLLSNTEARNLNCFVIGLGVAPIYRHPDTHDVFPLVLQKLHHGMAPALKKAAFAFSHNQTNHRPVSYQALGRQAVVKAVMEVDDKLAAISSQYDFLLLSTPVNIESALNAFQKGHCQKTPVFYYRPRPVDPSLLKYRLYGIQIEHVEDPTLAAIFHEKQREIDRQLSMLSDRDTRSFLYGSLQLYGSVSNGLLQLANNILRAVPPHSHTKTIGDYLSAEAFAEVARKEIDYYRQFAPNISATVEIRDDTVGLMVSRGNLLVSRKVHISAIRREALLQHEVGTHVLTYFNGQAQPLKLLYCGLTGYEELQEGIAVLAEYFVGGLDKARLRMLAGRVIAAHSMIEGASFVETYRLLNKDYGFAQRVAFIIATRTYRGGGLTKDIVYLKGLVKLMDYLKNKGEIEPLFVGKVAIEHVPIIKELQLRKVLHPMPLRPRYLEEEHTKLKLNQLRRGMSVLELIKGEKK